MIREEYDKINYDTEVLSSVYNLSSLDIAVRSDLNSSLLKNHREIVGWHFYHFFDL